MRIVPQELWEKAHARQGGLKRPSFHIKERAPFWERQRPRHLVTGLAKCGCCGSSYVKVGLTRFGCAGHKDRGTCENRLTIDGTDLESSILELLKTNLMAPEPFKAFCDELYRELNRLRIEASSTVEAQRAESARIDRRIKKIVAAITHDDAPVCSLANELRSLEARQDEIATALSNIQAPEPLIHPSVAEVNRRQVTFL